MARASKSKRDPLVFMAIHRLVDGVAVPTATKVYPGDLCEPATLICECDSVSYPEHWGNGSEPNAIGPRCPDCGAQYRLDSEVARDTECPPLPVGSSKDELLEREPEERSASVTEQPEAEPGATLVRVVDEVSSDGVVATNRDLTLEELKSKSQLNDEWLELELRLELLRDKKVEFLAAWLKDEKSVKRRIGQIKGELHAIAEGKTYEPPPTEVETKQLQMFDGGES